MLNHSDARTTEIYAQHIDRLGNPGEDIMEKVLFGENEKEIYFHTWASKLPR